MEKSLDELTPGESGVVLRVGGEGLMRRRLFDMGLTPGTTVTVKKMAPLGDPIEITVRGYELSVRKSEAEHVTMRLSGGGSL